MRPSLDRVKTFYEEQKRIQPKRFPYRPRRFKRGPYLHISRRRGKRRYVQLHDVGNWISRAVRAIARLKGKR